MEPQAEHQNQAHDPFSPQIVRGETAAAFLKRNRPGRLSTLEKVPSETVKTILNMIRVGASDHAAAAAFGIHPATWRKWLKRGSETTHGVFYALFCSVLEARGFAQMTAEGKVKEDNPLAWLRYGPCKKDWTENIHIESEQHVQGEYTHRQVMEELVPTSNIAEALAIAQQLNLIQPGPQGLLLFQSKQLAEQKEEGDTTDVIDVPHSNGNGKP